MNDEKAESLLVSFHTLANKGDLHIKDRERLYEFIQYVSDTPYMIDDIIQFSFNSLITQSNNPWPEDMARELVRKIRFGIELLRYPHGHL